ncbi:NAD-dependent epimerase/dehydratase family protein [Thiolapillus brandeum]|uniref:NAD-dependent epimerase/dehydratase n=1 Tax=Thiolapillus brandeum TaxID=1076588 RepID=A0A7U6GK57_9GAMM|nr:NAD-dependent epimerase/dehydratase family protein [Thiolapillus brandeum]BAO45087.1 NAD-dependent epimerase/dehydratase [Thiolapillus brandeum]
MTDHVIVTGGSGLLGASVVRLLLEEENVKPVVMDINRDPARLADVMDKIEYVQGDVSDPELLNSTFASFKPKTIYHIAAVLGDTCENKPHLAIKVNIDGFLSLLEAARDNGMAQVLFSSSGTTYGVDLEEGEMLTDKTVQRPASFYGVTKVFGENAGRYFKLKYGLDYRGIHYPAIAGPGLRDAGMVTYASAIIEKSVKGEPYTVPVSPDIRLSLAYVKDCARAIIQLGKAPVENIKTVNYFINGVQNPLPSSGEMVEMVKKRIPGAQIDFDVNEDWDRLLKSASHPVDDSSSIAEWGWKPQCDTYEKLIDAYIEDLKT